MFHAVIISIATCFGYTLYHFYAFSGTNLLTRCHSASSLFSAVFGFRKSIKEIFSELDETKTSSIISRGDHGVQRGVGADPPGGHATLGRGPGWARAPLWRGGPRWPPTPPLRLYILCDAKTLLRSIIFH